MVSGTEQRLLVVLNQIYASGMSDVEAMDLLVRVSGKHRDLLDQYRNVAADEPDSTEPGTDPLLNHLVDLLNAILAATPPAALNQKDELLASQLRELARCTSRDEQFDYVSSVVPDLALLNEMSWPDAGSSLKTSKRRVFVPTLRRLNQVNRRFAHGVLPVILLIDERAARVVGPTSGSPQPLGRTGFAGRIVTEQLRKWSGLLEGDEPVMPVI